MKRTPAAHTTPRREDLRKMLEARLVELGGDVRTRIGGLRTVGTPEVHGLGEDSDVDVQQDIDVAMIQLRAETSRQIEAALERIATGDYGDCSSCDNEIPTKRLQALPFAIRCIACEGAREDDDARTRRVNAGVRSADAGA